MISLSTMQSVGMSLRPGTRLFVNPSRHTSSERILLSAGTRGVRRAEIAQLGYHACARVPLEPWRLCHEAELSLLLAERDDPWRVEHSMAIVEVPPQLVAIARQERRSGARSAAVAAALASLAEWCLSADELEYLGLYESAPGLLTTTMSHAVGAAGRTGLHVDSWQGTSGPRSGRRNRICINVGNEARYFLFVNLPFDTVAAEHSSLQTNSSTVVSAFLVQNSSYPVVRLRVEPGEAYIAPTENLIHDATTLPKASVDMLVTVLGNFGLKPRAVTAASTSPFAPPSRRGTSACVAARQHTRIDDGADPSGA